MCIGQDNSDYSQKNPSKILTFHVRINISLFLLVGPLFPTSRFNPLVLFLVNLLLCCTSSLVEKASPF